MSEQKKIKPDLMRFATLRTPQKIDEDKKALGFVFHPNPANDHFLANAINVSDIQKARAIVALAVETFKPVSSSEDIKKLDLGMFKFSVWLMENRTRLNKKEVDSRANGVAELSQDDRVRVWEQLHYEVIKRRSSYIRKACIQMILADNFVKKMSDAKLLKLINKPRLPQSPAGDEAEVVLFNGLAHAKVAIDERFTVAKQKPRKVAPPYNNYGFIHAIQNRAIGLGQVAQLIAVQGEIVGHGKKHSRDLQSAREKYRKSILARVDKDKSEFLKRHKLDSMSIAERKRIDPETLPRFEAIKSDFKFQKPFSKEYVAINKLSSLAQELIEVNQFQDESVKSFQRRVGKAIKIESREAQSPIAISKSKIKIGNDVFSIRPNDDLAFSVAIRPLQMIRRRGALYLTIRVGYRNPGIKKMSYQLDVEGDIKKSKKYTIIDNSAKSLTLNLLPDVQLKYKKESTFSFDATIELSDSRVLQLSVRGIVGSQYNHGVRRHSASASAASRPATWN